MRAFKSLLRAVGLRPAPQAERELNEEIEFHLTMAAESWRKRGLDGDSAQRRARLEFGSVERTKQESREAMPFADLRKRLNAMRISIRSLWHSRSFTVAAIATLALSVSTITIMLAMLRQAMFAPLPYREPDRLVVVREVDAVHPEHALDVSPGNFINWAEQTAALTHFGVAEPSGVTVVLHGRRQSFSSWNVSAPFVEALGLEVALGRTFRPQEFVAQDAGVALISHATWQERFAGDTALMGRQLEMDGELVEVIGVLPPSADFPAARDFWIPWSLSPHHRHIRQGNWMVAAGRLKPDVTTVQANADLQRIARNLANQYRETNANAGVIAEPLPEYLLRDIGRALWSLTLASGFFLLAACATVTGLYLTRLRARSPELSVRTVLGATPAVLGRQIISELLLLALLAAVVALVLVPAYLALLKLTAPEQLPQIARLSVDGFVVASILLLLPLMAIGCGIWPTLHVVSETFMQSMQESSRATVDRRRARGRNTLIVAQVAVATTLLIGAALMSSSLGRLLNQDLGFEGDGVLSLQVFADMRTAEERIVFFEEVQNRLRRLPGVQAAAATSALPFHPSQIDPRDDFRIVDRVDTEPADSLVAHTLVATPGYFEVMGIPVLAGRAFSEFDRAGNARVAVINHTMAQRYWPTESAIGQRVRIGIMGPPQEWEIVGVVGDVRPYSFESPPREELYVPHAQAGVSGMTLVFRSDRSPETLRPSLERVFAELWPLQSIYHSATVASLIAQSMATRTFAMVVLSGFTLGAVALALLGLYSLVTYTVALRRREIGIRATLGAPPQRICGTIVRQALRLALLGVAIGTSSAALIAPSLRALLYDVQPLSPMIYLAAVVAMLGTAALAAWLPAWRAVRMAPAALMHLA